MQHLTVTNKVKHQVKYRYRMEGEVVKSASSTPYLGVTINSKLTWNNHIDGITSSANPLLGFLWRNMHRCPPTLKERAYTAMVRPKLEYCSSVWNHCRQKHANQLEMVQRRAARFVMNKPHRRQDTSSVTEMVHHLKWQSLQWRTHSRVTMMYRITKAIVDVPASYHPCQKPRGEPWQFQQHQPTVDCYKYSSVPRTIVDWNALPEQVARAESLDIFKQRLAPPHLVYNSVHL